MFVCFKQCFNVTLCVLGGVCIVGAQCHYIVLLMCVMTSYATCHRDGRSNNILP